MFRMFFLIPILMIVGACNSQPVSQPDSTRHDPSIEIVPTILELGTVEADKSIHTRITLANTGKCSSTIEAIFRSCKCVDVSIDKNVIEPSQIAIVTLQVRPARNTKSTSIRIVADGEELYVPIVWSVISKVRVDESLLNFGRVDIGQCIERSISIEVAESIVLDDILVETSPSDLLVGTFDARSKVVNLKVIADRAGNYQGELRIVRVIEERREIMGAFPVVWRVDPVKLD